MSTDGGVVMVARHLRSSGWFKALVTQAHQAILKMEGERFGFAQEDKLQRTLLALVAGLAMGYRNGNEIATVIAGDRLWREVLGKRVTQPDISRLVDLLSRVGIDPLRAALLASAGDGGQVPDHLPLRRELGRKRGRNTMPRGGACLDICSLEPDPIRPSGRIGQGQVRTDTTLSSPWVGRHPIRTC